MAEPHNNNLAMDTFETRLYRLLRMQNNIGTHAAALGIAGPILTWGQTCHTRYSGAVTEAGVGSGEAKDATIMVHRKFAVALDYFQQAKDILAAMLEQFKPDEFLLASYGIDKRTPQIYPVLIEAIGGFVATHNRLVAEGDERVLDQSIIDKMAFFGNEFEVELAAAGVEKREKDDAYRLQHTYFAGDTIMLRLIFKIACMVWGDDDPKLKDLGLVPATEIWTKKKKVEG